MISKETKFKKGLTLIELIIVLALIGVLAGISVYILNPVSKQQRARDAQRKSHLRQIQSALEMYRSDQGNYPTSLSNCGSPFAQGTTVYLQKIPCDPLDSSSYFYTTSPAGCDNGAGGNCTGYSIFACLENTSDSEKDSTNICTGSRVSYTLNNP